MRKQKSAPESDYLRKVSVRLIGPEERERFRKMLHRVIQFRQDPAAWAHAKRLITYAYRGLLRERRTTLGLRSVDDSK